MNSERVSKKPPAIAVQLRRTFWQRLVDAFFGYDFFISYAHADGKLYAEGIARQLKQHGFECFLDTKESFKGDDWQEIGYWALKRTSQLILVGTQKALESEPVLREVRIFAARKKKIVPIDFSGSLALDKNPNNDVLQIVRSSVLQIRESIDLLQQGPSVVAVEELEKSFQNIRQSVKRRRSLQAFAGILLFLVVVAFWQYLIAEKQQKEAFRQLATISWSIAEVARDQEQDPLKAAHYFLSAANLDERIGNLNEAKNAILAAQIESSSIYKSLVHGEPIQGVCSSPDGTFLVTWDDNSAQLWDSQSGNQIGNRIKQSVGIYGCLFNNSGTRFLTMSSDGTVNLWNGTNASAVGLSITNCGSMGGADFSPDGKLLSTWGADNTTRLWNVKDGSPFGKPMNLGQQVWHSEFNSNGKYILTWSMMGRAQLWNVENCEAIGNQIQVSPNLEAALFIENGSEIATWSGNGAVQSWSLTNGVTTNLLWQGEQNKRLLAGVGRNWVWRREADGTTLLWKILDASIPALPKRNKIFISQSLLFNSNPVHNTNVPSFDRTKFKLWSSEDPTSLGEILKTETDMDTIVFSLDDSRIVTLNRQKVANLFNASNGQQIGQPLKHASTVLGATFSGDSKRVLTWSEDGTAKLWDSFSGDELGYSMNHQQTVNGGYFLKDGTNVLTWSADGIARIWNIESQPTNNQTNHPAVVNGAIFNKDGTQILIWGAGGAAQLWNGTNTIGQPMTHGGAVNGAMFSPNQRYIVTFSADGTAKLWNVKDASLIGQPIKHNASVVGAVFSADSTRIITWSADRRAQLSRTDDAKPIGDFMHPVLGVEFSVDSKRFVTHGQDYQNFGDQFAQIWDSVDGHPIGPHLLHSNTVVSATFTPDGQQVITCGLDASARLWDKNGKLLDEPFVLKPTDYRSNWMNEIEGTRFSPDGRQALFWNNLGVAQSWNLDTGKPITAIMAHRYVNKEGIVGGTFSPDGSEILTWGADGVARIWDARNGRPIGRPMTHATKITSATFDPLQKHILTLSDDGIVKLWNVDGSEIGQPLKHKDTVNGAIFDANGSKVLTWSDDGTARLWDASNAQCIGIFNHGGAVDSACFSPDGKQVLTASADGMARLWDISVDETVPLKQRILEYEVQSATRLDTDGEVKALTPEEWIEAKRLLAQAKASH
jgi:WD40 repeat protein